MKKQDWIFLAGAVLLLGGIAAIYWPAALITAGSGLLVVAAALHKDEKPKEEKPNAG